MDKVLTEEVLETVPGLENTAYTVSRGIHGAVLSGGTTVRAIADFFHGVWLGHPLHLLLTDLVVSTWTLGALIDLFNLNRRESRFEQAADQLITLGVAAAVPTAIAGFTDYSTISQRAVKTGMIHGLLNTLSLILNVVSLTQRRKGNRNNAVMLSSLVAGMLTFTAWLGGELSYRYRVGVNKNQTPDRPQDWTPVMSEYDLAEGQAIRREVDGHPVLLYRYGGTVYAIGAVCSHEGGPLEEGSFDGYCVECPWHHSVYDVRDGSVVHGPSTYAQPNYQARILNSQIEIRLPV